MTEPYENYNTEAEIFLRGEYLTSEHYPSPNLLTHRRILQSVSLPALSILAARSQAAKTSLREMFELADNGRRIIQVVPNKETFEHQVPAFHILKAFLDAYPEYYEKTGSTPNTLVDCLLSNSVPTHRRVKFSRQLLREVPPDEYKKYAAPRYGTFPSPWKSVVDAVFEAIKGCSATVLLTTNPLDFLLSAQEGACDFGSCHSLDGEHALGNVTYALNDFTMMAAALASAPTEFPFRKLGRQWIQFDQPNQTAAFHKRYGNIPKPASDAVMEMLLEEYRTKLGLGVQGWRINPGWVLSDLQISNAGHRNTRVKTNINYPAYVDDALLALATQQPPSQNPHVQFVYPNAMCLNCGEDIESGPNAFRYLRCAKCGPWDMPKCVGCGTGTENMPLEDGRCLCSDCYIKEFVECSGCRTRISRLLQPDGLSLTGDGSPHKPRYACLGCVNKQYHICLNCGLPTRHAAPPVCVQCYDKVSYCDPCGREFYNPLRGKCPDCGKKVPVAAEAPPEFAAEALEYAPQPVDPEPAYPPPVHELIRFRPVRPGYRPIRLQAVHAREAGGWEQAGHGYMRVPDLDVVIREIEEMI